MIKQGPCRQSAKTARTGVRFMQPTDMKQVTGATCTRWVRVGPRPSFLRSNMLDSERADSWRTTAENSERVRDGMAPRLERADAMIRPDGCAPNPKAPPQARRSLGVVCSVLCWSSRLERPPTAVPSAFAGSSPEPKPRADPGSGQGLLRGEHDRDDRNPANPTPASDARRTEPGPEGKSSSQPGTTEPGAGTRLAHRIRGADGKLHPPRARDHLPDGHRPTPRQHAPDRRPARRRSGRAQLAAGHRTSKRETPPSRPNAVEEEGD